MPEKTQDERAPLTSARQTMSAWSCPIKSLEEVPPAYLSFFNTLPDIDQAFPTTVFAPRLDRLLNRTSEKVICDANDSLHVLERVGSQLLITSYPWDTIGCIEMGRILLHAWITIYGTNVQGENASSIIEFNSTSERFYLPFLKKFRPQAPHTHSNLLRLEQKKFDDLARVNFKLMNAGRNSLTGAEKVVRHIWQPEVRIRRVMFRFLPLYRTLTTAHLLILSDQEVILIREDERSHPNKGVRYGGIYHYLPLRNIRSTSLTPCGQDWINFSLKYGEGFQLETLFASSLKPDLEQFQNDLLKLQE